MKQFQPPLYDEVLRVFARACREAEFGLADHLLDAIEFIAQQEGRSEQVDFAYLLVADFCVRSADNAAMDSGQKRRTMKPDGRLRHLASRHGRYQRLRYRAS